MYGCAWLMEMIPKFAGRLDQSKYDKDNDTTHNHDVPIAGITLNYCSYTLYFIKKTNDDKSKKGYLLFNEKALDSYGSTNKV